MKIALDFSLSERFGVVEQTIFRLVIGGVVEIKTITALLSVFSDEVIANSIQKLVNYQLLNVNIESQTLHLSEVILALIESCIEHSKELELPTDTAFIIGKNREYIRDIDTKQRVLSSLLPGINTGFLVKSLNFVVHEVHE